MPNATTTATQPPATPSQPIEVGPAPTLGVGFLGFLVGAAALYFVLRRGRRSAQHEGRDA